jgi:hypothetical protein
MDVLIFNKVCLYDVLNNQTILYGQYKNTFESIHIDTEHEYSVVLSEDRPDFYIRIKGKVDFLQKLVYNNNYDLCDITLIFPFENCDLDVSPTSAIISTFCKDYSHRLDEWIQYNLKLGFSGIVIFNNDSNQSNTINESIEHCIHRNSISDICNKYKTKVWMVDMPYSPFPGEHWNMIQRITLSIGVNAFRTKCSHIALIDADEFIHIPSSSENPNIEEFLKGRETITMRSNILTNKNNDDQIDNNVLKLAKYVGEDKYTKTILCTNKIKEYEFIFNPHEHHTQTILDKNEIIHYHCWINNRYHYWDGMQEIDFLQNFI